MKTVYFTLDESSLAFYDDAREAWIAEAGSFEILIGSSAIHIHSSAKFEWNRTVELGGKENKPRLHTGLTVQSLLEDVNGRAILNKHLAPLLEHPQLQMALGMSLDQIAAYVPDVITPELLKAINNDLASI